jgi:hypothetical protein
MTIHAIQKKPEKESNQLITVYRPNQRHNLGFLETWIVMSKNIISSNG